MFPKGRVEALTDGIFAVAMTILVLDLRLPETPEIGSQAQLLAALSEVLPKFLPYLLSFYVLGKDWVSLSRLQSSWKEMSVAHANRTLVYLLLVTLVPFSTTIMGRYGQFPLASCLYLANLAAVAVVLLTLLPHRGDPAEGNWVERRNDIRVFISTCVVAGVLCYFFGPNGLWVLALNAAIPRILRRRKLKTGGVPPSR